MSELYLIYGLFSAACYFTFLILTIFKGGGADKKLSEELVSVGYNHWLSESSSWISIITLLSLTAGIALLVRTIFIDGLALTIFGLIGVALKALLPKSFSWRRANLARYQTQFCKLFISIFFVIAVIQLLFTSCINWEMHFKDASTVLIFSALFFTNNLISVPSNKKLQERGQNIAMSRFKGSP